MKHFHALLVIVCLLLTGVACGRGDDVVVGSKAFTESVVLGEAARQLLAHEGHPSRHRATLGGSTVLFNALLAGEIDIYPEYTGTLLQELLASQNLDGDDALRDALKTRGVGMSRPLGFNNTYAFGVPRRVADARGLRTMSDLRRHPDLRTAFGPEYLQRGDGWPAVRDFYGLPQRADTSMDHDLAYRALAAGEADLMDLYSTDAEIAFYDLVALEDDRGFFPRYDAVLLYRLDLPDNVVATLRRLEGVIDEGVMTAANEAAKLRRVPEALAARDLLNETLGVDTTEAAVTGDASRTRRIVATTLRHAQLVGVAVALATLFAVPLGVLAARGGVAGAFVMPAVGLLQTIPSLALLALMIPTLPAVGLPGLGVVPATIALTLYALLPVARNTQQGIASIPHHVRESADALGLPGWTLLRRVELPLAMPSILAGVKTATVITVGFATLGAFVGAGGYGEPILNGLRLARNDLILEGAIPAAVMAVAAQFGLDLLGRRLVPRGLG